MKRNTKHTTLLSVVALVCVMIFGLTACGKTQDSNGQDSDGRQVTDSEWTQALTINVETYESYTVISERIPTYGKERAEEYGEWEYFCSTDMLDTVNEVIYSHSVTETYDPKNKNAVDGFVKFESYSYTLCRSGKYYTYSSQDGKSVVEEITKADYIHSIDEVKYVADASLALASMYAQPEMKTQFQYNKDEQMYEIQLGGIYVGFRFFDNGVLQRTKVDSLNILDVTISGYNATVINVPYHITQEINDYKAK